MIWALTSSHPFPNKKDETVFFFLIFLNISLTVFCWHLFAFNPHSKAYKAQAILIEINNNKIIFQIYKLFYGYNNVSVSVHNNVCMNEQQRLFCFYFNQPHLTANVQNSNSNTCANTRLSHLHLCMYICWQWQCVYICICTYNIMYMHTYIHKDKFEKKTSGLDVSMTVGRTYLANIT